MSRFAKQTIVVCVFALFVLAGSLSAEDNAVAQPAGQPIIGQPIIGQPMIGELAPSFSLLDQNGNTVSSDDLRGSFVVVHLAASW